MNEQKTMNKVLTMKETYIIKKSVYSRIENHQISPQDRPD